LAASTSTPLEPAPPAAGRAPSADLQRFWNLTWTLAVTDFKLRFYGSFLGYFWTLARPFAFFGVIYVVFTEIAKIGEDVKHYGAYILLAMVLFQFFGESTSNCVNSLVNRENLLRKMRFPRLVIPLSVVLTALFNLLMTLVAVLIFALINGVRPTWAWLELPVLIVILAVLSVGTGMLLSALYVRYRDMQPIWDVFTQMLFYASPVLYVASMVPEDYQRPYLANPLAAVLTEMRHAVIDPTARPVWEAIGGAERLLIPGAIVVLVFALGWWVFQREAPRIAENL
jgi:ABC-2 type transport system permease protein